MEVVTFRISLLKFCWLMFCSFRSIQVESKEEADKFLSRAAQENKPRVVLLSRKTSLPLLFQLVAFEHRQRVECAFISLSSKHGPAMLRKHDMDPDQPTLLFFKEDPTKPVSAHAVSLIFFSQQVLLFCNAMDGKGISFIRCSYCYAMQWMAKASLSYVALTFRWMFPSNLE